MVSEFFRPLFSTTAGTCREPQFCWIWPFGGFHGRFTMSSFDGFPYGIKHPALQARLQAAYNPMNRLLNPFRKTTSPRHYSSAAVGYPIFFLKTLADLDRLYAVVKADLANVTAPTLILQASEDDFTSVKNSEFVLSRIASTDKKLVLLDDSYHVITVDRQRDR